jgi:tetratricopeptide (TPR) repeat protein
MSRSILFFAALPLALYAIGCSGTEIIDDPSGWPEAEAKAFDDACALTAKDAFADAHKIYLKLASSHPESALVKNNLGDALMRMGELEAAETCFRDAVRLDNANAIYYYNFGNLLLKKGDTAPALWAFDRARALDPENPAYPWGQGRAYQARGYRPEAERSFLDALKLNADYEPAVRSMAMAKYEDMHYAEALDYFKKLLLKNREEEQLYFYCAHCLWNLREYENAVKLIKRFLATCLKASPERRKIAEGFVEKVEKHIGELKALKEDSSASEPPEEISRGAMDSMMKEYGDVPEKSGLEPEKTEQPSPAPEPPAEPKEEDGGPDDLKSLRDASEKE